jgi:hypothetical protein
VIALALLVGLRSFDRYCGGRWLSEGGHRRPVLFGLWQPGPRDEKSVEARFRANIRTCGPNWGQPVWGDWTPRDFLDDERFAAGDPHHLIVRVPYSAAGQKYEVEAAAFHPDSSSSLRIYVYMVRDRGRFRRVLEGTSPARGELSLAGSLLCSDPRFPVCQAAAAEIDNALRDALE